VGKICVNRRGNLPGVSGDLSGIRGNLSHITGDLSGVWGDLTGIQGNIEECEITPEERRNGVDIQDLIS